MTAKAPTSTASPVLAGTGPRSPSLRYAWYVVIVLMTCYTLSFIDRQILSLLVGPIKHDLQISDTRIGLLQGLAFATFYTLLGLPVGRVADRHSRRNLIATGIFLWSLMTALCSVAKSFGSLFLARMGVGVGEATLAPAAFSIISDYFPEESLGTALSVYAMGIFIGSGLALIVGGTVVSAVSGRPETHLPLIGAIASWRLTFLIVGLPGVIVGFLIYTIREPLRRNLQRAADGQITRPGIAEAAAQIRRRWKPVAGVSMGLSCQAMCNYALLAWAPTYFQRVYGWGPRKTGIALGIIILTIGVFGMYSGGRLCDRWKSQGKPEAPLRVGVISTASAGTLFVLSMLAPGITSTLVLFALSQIFLAMPVGSSYAALQFIFPNQLRGQVSALLIFTINVGGVMLGPLLPGLFNDHLFKNGNLVGYSLALTIGGASLLSAILFRSIYRPYRASYYELRQETLGEPEPARV
ncbi:MAG TPA: MFS transporter [Blastocatellia bacterium]|nr:MFS transporter [Blastocatellia bacterium]